MKPKDWFGVGVRLIGVWLLVSAAQELVYLLLMELGYLKSGYAAGTYVIHAGGDFLIGLFLISGARMLVSFAGNWDANSTRCESCGYNLTANVSGVCPECGKGREQ